MNKRTKSIGSNIPKPKNVCNDDKCPFHGNLKTRGKQFVGVVISDKMQRSIVVEWETKSFIKKYERYKKSRTKVPAHNPLCINAVEGDQVKIMECRPISKTKSFVVVQVLGKEDLYSLEKQRLEEGKFKEKAKEIINKQKVKDEGKMAEESPVAETAEE